MKKQHEHGPSDKGPQSAQMYGRMWIEEADRQRAVAAVTGGPGTGPGFTGPYWAQGFPAGMVTFWKGAAPLNQAWAGITRTEDGSDLAEIDPAQLKLEKN